VRWLSISWENSLEGSTVADRSRPVCVWGGEQGHKTCNRLLDIVQLLLLVLKLLLLSLILKLLFDLSLLKG
jgi:hypothetical protein